MSPKLRTSQPSSSLLGIGHLVRIRRDQLNFYRGLRERHGDIVRLRLGPYRTWILFHPDHIETVLTREWSSFIRFEKLMKVLRQWNGDSLLLAEGAEWRERRRTMMPAFKSRRMPQYAAVVADHVGRLTESWRRELDGRDYITVNTDAVMAHLTLDIATKALFGAEPLANGDDVEAAIQVLSDTAFQESTAPFAFPDWLPLASKRRKLWAMGVMDRTITGLVSRRLEVRGEKVDRESSDLLAMLVEQHLGEATAIRNDSMSLLIAGHETSGALLSWIFACLARAPDQLRLIQEELRAVLQGRPPSLNDLPSLPQTNAVVEETLRLYPPAYSLFLRRATRDLLIGGVRICAGDNVLIVPFAVHRDPRWFIEPESFVPQRFRQAATWPQYAYLPFGAGPRVCIGQSFALVEASIAAATILQRWAPTCIKEMPKPCAKFSLRPLGGLPLNWRPV